MAKTIRNEDLRLNIIINGDQGRKQILDQEQAVRKLNDQLAKEKQQLAELEKQGGQAAQSKQADSLRKSIEKTNEALRQETSRLESLKRQLSVNSMTMEELEKHVKATSAALRTAVPGTENWTRLNKELKDSKARLQELRDASKSTGAAIKGITPASLTASLIKAKVAIQGTIAAVRTLARAAGSVVGTMASFEQANVNLSTILGTSTDAMKALTDEAIRLGAKTRYSASQVTELQTALAKLGFTQEQILSMGEPVLNFATAVGADLGEAASLAGAALRMFGLRAEDAEPTLSALAVATNKSALSFTYLQEALSIVGPVARTFGIGIKDTIALLGTLSNVGFDASQAATATRNILLNLANASGDLAKALGQPARTFPEITAALKKLNEQGVDLATTLELTDKRSVSAFNAFLAGAGDAEELRAALEGTSGALQELADTRMNTLEGSILTLQSAWERLILTFRESTGPLKSVTDWLGKMVNKLADFNLEVSTGGKTAKDRAFDADLLKRFQTIADTQGRDEMIRQYEQWEKDAEAAYDRALDAYTAHRSKKNEKAMKEAGRYAMGLSDMRSQIMAYGAPAPDTSTGEPTPEPTTDNPTDKSKGTWSLHNDEAFLKAKAELTRQYNEGEIKDTEEYNRKVLELETATLAARLAAGKESGQARAKLESDLQSRIMKQKESERKKAETDAKALAQLREELLAIEQSEAARKEAAEERRYQEERKKFEGNAAALEDVERRHQANLRAIRVAGYEERAAEEDKAYRLARAKREAELADELAQAADGVSKARIRRDTEAELARMDVERLQRKAEELRAIMEAGSMDGTALTDKELDELEAKLAEIQKQLAKAVATLAGAEGGASRGTGRGSLFGVSQAQWNQFLANLQDGKLKAEDVASAIGAIEDASRQAMQVWSQALSLRQALKERDYEEYKKDLENRQKALKKSLDAGMLTQAQYDARVEEMNEEQAKKEEAMKLEQARSSKAYSVVQAIINTALAVTKTFAEWGWPQGIAPAAIMGALGAAQVAMIAAQPVTGKAEGGPVSGTRVTRAQDGRTFSAQVSPDKRGWIRRPTVIVGEEGSEYVIPHEALENPTIIPLIQAMETARRNGQLRTVNLAAYAPAQAAQASGYSEGGMTQGAPATREGTQGGQAPTDTRLAELLDRLDRTLSEPIRAEVAMLGRRGIVESLEKYQRQQDRGKLG